MSAGMDLMLKETITCSHGFHNELNDKFTTYNFTGLMDKLQGSSLYQDRHSNTPIETSYRLIHIHFKI